MSYHDYTAGRDIAMGGCSFYAIIQAAMRKADTPNLDRLKAAWPRIWDELQARYDAPGGYLPDDPEKPQEVK